MSGGTAQGGAGRRDPIQVYDARWEVHEFDDAAVVRLFAAALTYGRELGADTVVLTRDARLGAARVLALGVDTAQRMGYRTLVNPQPISTPQAYFAALHVAQEHPCVLGLAVTASHNPGNYIGVKFTVPVAQAIGLDCGPRGGLRRVRELYHEGPLEARSGGTLRLIDLSREYVEYGMRTAGVQAGSLAGVRVVLDAMNGAAGPEVFTTLTRAGAEVRPLRLFPDGNFPTGSPNPTSQGKLEDAVRAAAEWGAAVVIGLDGDGDRIVFGDGRGLLTAGFAFVPILRACLADAAREPAPLVLHDPKVSPLALAAWGQLGARPVLFRNGHSQIKEYMSRVGVVAAAEESGHFYHRLSLGGRTISGENSLVTILLLLASLHREPALLATLREMQAQVFTTGEFNYQFESDERRNAALAAVVARLVADNATIATTTPDGIDLQGTCVARGVRLAPGRAELEAGWYSGYLRVATNEKAVVRAYFSAGDVASGGRVEELARGVLGGEFAGRVID
jgi:phosphomannomutase